MKFYTKLKFGLNSRQSKNTLLRKMFWLYIVFFIIASHNIQRRRRFEMQKRINSTSIDSKIPIKGYKDNSRAYLKRVPKVNII